MKSPKIIVALILVAISCGHLAALGVVALASQDTSYTIRERRPEIGQFEVTTKETKRIPLSPIVGAITFVGGVGLLVVDRRKAWVERSICAQACQDGQTTSVPAVEKRCSSIVQVSRLLARWMAA